MKSACLNRRGSQVIIDVPASIWRPGFRFSESVMNSLDRIQGAIVAVSSLSFVESAARFDRGKFVLNMLSHPLYAWFSSRTAKVSSDPAPTQRGFMFKILIVCWVTELLQSKMNILDDAGYQISTAVNPEQADILASESEFDLVIFGNCVPAPDRSRIAANFKQNHPGIRVIMPYVSSIEKVELA